MCASYHNLSLYNYSLLLKYVSTIGKFNALVIKTLFKLVKKGFLSRARGRPNSSCSKKFLPFKLDITTDLRRHCLSRLKMLFKSGARLT